MMIRRKIMPPMYSRRDIKCPLKRCEEFGRSKVCYKETYAEDCNIYNNKEFITDFVYYSVNGNRKESEGEE